MDNRKSNRYPNIYETEPIEEEARKNNSKKNSNY